MRAFFIFALIVPLALPALAEDEKMRILVMDLKTTGVDGETAALVGELMSVRLSDFNKFEVYSGADVKRLVELEANKAAMGCEDTSCLADIAGALGARYVIYGRMGKLGSRYIVTLNLFDADTAKALQRGDIKARDLDEMADKLNDTVSKLVSPLVGETVGQIVTDATPVESDAAVGGIREPSPLDQAKVGGMPLTPILLIGAGAAVGAVGAGWDVFSPTSRDGKLGFGDFFGPIGYAAALGLAVGGLFALEAN